MRERWWVCTSVFQHVCTYPLILASLGGGWSQTCSCFVCSYSVLTGSSLEMQFIKPTLLFCAHSPRGYFANSAASRNVLFSNSSSSFGHFRSDSLQKLGCIFLQNKIMVPENLKCIWKGPILTLTFGWKFNFSVETEEEGSGVEAHRKHSKCGPCKYKAECDEDAENVGWVVAKGTLHHDAAGRAFYRRLGLRACVLANQTVDATLIDSLFLYF